MSAEAYAEQRFTAQRADAAFRDRLVQALNAILPGVDHADPRWAADTDVLIDERVVVVALSTAVGEITTETAPCIIAVHDEDADHEFRLAAVTVVTQ